MRFGHASLSPWALLVVGLVACSSSGRPVAHARASPPSPADFGFSSIEAEGMDPLPFLDLATWVRDHPVPIFSFLVSRNGHVVFELYTSSLDRDAAHYMMSVTKSVVSTLVGIAIDRRLLPSPDAPIVDTLPADLFGSETDRDRFRAVTIKDLLAMSALDAPDPPRSRTPEALARHRAFLASDNRVRFALTQVLVTAPGQTFLYNDIGPSLATGMITYAAHESALRFAEENLFGPMEFQHYEWMHEDPSGIDNGGYGLRLRPVDMQKLGVLYLHRGSWHGRQLVPAAWVDASFTPWMRSNPDRRDPDYGWYWWSSSFGPHWMAHAAKGWKGQRIVVVPEQGIVVTMTAYVNSGDEDALATRLIEDYIVPSVEHGKNRSLGPNAQATASLSSVLEEVRRGPSRAGPDAEPRMIPSVSQKEEHHEPAR